MFDGPESPITQTFGLGLAGLRLADVEAIEAFFSSRGAATHHEVCPLAGVETYALLSERGYRPVELSNVLVLSLDEALPSRDVASALPVRKAGPRDEEAWVSAAARGWTDDPAFADMIRSFSRISFASDAVTKFLVELDGVVVATGSLGAHEGIALLAGASTVPEARRRGAQRALFTERLHEAKRLGCSVAMMVAAPGSTSQHNAERSGFRVAYSRTKWRRALAV
jgi:hypothetical protein